MRRASDQTRLDESGREWRRAAEPRATKEVWRSIGAADRRVADRLEWEEESDQRNGKYRKAQGGGAMDRALVMLVLVLRRGGCAVRVSETKLEARRGLSGGELRRHHPGEHGVEHERIGGDPAGQLPPWALRYLPLR